MVLNPQLSQNQPTITSQNSRIIYLIVVRSDPMLEVRFIHRTLWEMLLEKHCDSVAAAKQRKMHHVSWVYSTGLAMDHHQVVSNNKSTYMANQQQQQQQQLEIVSSFYINTIFT